MSRTSAPASSTVSVRTVVGVLVAIALVVWIVGNRGPVSVSFLVTTATVPLWVALTIAAAVGLVVGFLLGRRRYARR